MKRLFSKTFSSLLVVSLFAGIMAADAVAVDAVASGSPAAQGRSSVKIEGVKAELKRCLVRLGGRVMVPIRQIDNLCASIEVTADHARGTTWEARVQMYESPDGRLANLVLWGERGVLLLEQSELPAGGGPLDVLVLALDLESELPWGGAASDSRDFR
jgi:hypothetical protein